MEMLALSFAGVVVITFGIFAFMLRPTPEQKALDRRVHSIKASSGEIATSQDLEQFLKAPRDGSFGWLEDLMPNFSIFTKLEKLILQADSKVSVGTVIITTLGLAGGVLALTYLVLSMWPVASLAGFGAGLIPFNYLRVKRNRRVKAFNKALPDCVDMMARSLRAGHSMVATINIISEQAVAPAGMEFGEVFKKQNYGLPLRDALMEMLERVPSQDLRVLVTGILVQKETGGNLSEILDRIVSVIRERLRIQGEIRVHTAQGRLTGWILTALPVVMLLLINLIDPGYSNVLVNDPTGREMLYAGLVLLCIGGFIIRQIIKGIEV